MFTTKVKMNIKGKLGEKKKSCVANNIQKYKIPRKYIMKTMITDFRMNKYSQGLDGFSNTL